MNANINALEESAKGLAMCIIEQEQIAVIHHYDADGIASGAIIIKALQSIGKQVAHRGIKQLYTETIEELKGLSSFFVFTDFGSSHIKELEKAFGNQFVVIDHHQPKYPRSENFLNCWHFGINGTIEASGAALAYLVAKHISEDNCLAPLAIIGAVGDMQDSNEGLLGLNREILLEASESKLIEAKLDLRLYGRFTRPLVQFLTYSTDPIIPNLTGNEENCARFLMERGFELKEDERWLCYEDLSYEEKQKLATELIVYMRSLDVPEWKIARLIGEVYTLLNEPIGPLRDAKEYATLLNACGRNNAIDLGLAVCLGDRNEKYSKALELLAEHRRKLREGLQLIAEEGLQEAKNFYYFNAGKRIKDSLIGVIAGMLYSSAVISNEKPIVAFAEQEDGFVKVSARATQELVTKGLNLGKIMQECCSALGGKAEGGGHQIAAGARIAGESLESFLMLFDKKVEEQLKKVYQS